MTKNSATKTTPAEDRKPFNQLQVKARLEMKRNIPEYPDVSVGDYKTKKGKWDRERE